MIAAIEFGVPVEIALLLALVAFAAGLVDAIAGGGGLITVPALLLAGLSPVAAIATNKLQGTFGVAASTLAFWRAGKLEPGLILPLGAASLIGGIAGASMVHLAPTTLLRLVIPFLLIAIALYLSFSPRLGDEDAHPRMRPLRFAASFGLLIGLYDGGFGPGAGTFYLLGLIALVGFGIMRAMAHTKGMNFASNLGGLVFFAFAGQIEIALGLLMGLCAALGATCGAKLALRHGATLIKPLVIVIAILMALRLMLDPVHPVGASLRRLIGS